MIGGCGGVDVVDSVDYICVIGDVVVVLGFKLLFALLWFLFAVVTIIVIGGEIGIAVFVAAFLASIIDTAHTPTTPRQHHGEKQKGFKDDNGKH